MNIELMLETLTLDTIIYYIFLVVILLISIWLHEYAHAWTSYKFWDPTPVLQWRLTPNPLKHIDIVWFISVFLIWFWWWKPVQINPIYYKDPKKDELFTALAGPAMNLVLAFLWMFILMVYAKIFDIWVQDLLLSTWDFVILFWQMFIIMNIWLAVFNMIPFPPLDGFRLIKVFWRNWAQWMEKNAMWISLWLIILIVSWSPVISYYISTVSDVIYRLFFMLFSLIFY